MSGLYYAMQLLYEVQTPSPYVPMTSITNAVRGKHSLASTACMPFISVAATPL